MKEKDTMCRMRQALYALEEGCKSLDCNTLFFGPKKYIQDLWVIINHQKEYIQMLERKLQTLGVEFQLPQRAQKPTVQACTIHGRVIGSVLGHETQVVQSLHQQLHHQHIALKILDNQAVEPASITLLFHRKKARLPQDEIEALLGSASTQGTPGHTIIIFMHNIVSGHENRLFKAVGPNNTDPGSWPALTQQCLLISDMTFDETKFDWNDINKNALHVICQAISGTVSQHTSSTANQHTSSHDQDRQPANQQGKGIFGQMLASYHGSRPSTYFGGQQYAAASSAPFDATASRERLRCESANS